jgi:hypothetical protein
MRKTILYIATSFDGYVGRPNDDVDWMDRYANVEYGEQEFLMMLAVEPNPLLLRNATPSVFHQRHIGRVLRSSCIFAARRLASSRGGEPRAGRCPPLWPGDLRNAVIWGRPFGSSSGSRVKDCSWQA